VLSRGPHLSKKEDRDPTVSEREKRGEGGARWAVRMGRVRELGRARGERGSWACWFPGVGGLFSFFFFLFCFPFQKPFPNKILSANKFKPETNNTKYAPA